MKHIYFKHSKISCTDKDNNVILTLQLKIENINFFFNIIPLKLVIVKPFVVFKLFKHYEIYLL